MPSLSRIRLHIVGRLGLVARRVAGVKPDQVLEELNRLLAGFGEVRCRRGGLLTRNRRPHRQDDQQGHDSKQRSHV